MDGFTHLTQRLFDARGSRPLLSTPAAHTAPPPRCRRQPQSFPSLYDPPSRFLSVVVPAYNEEKRMRVGLDEMVAVLKEKQGKDSCVW